jgi:hypothetical protein
MLFALVIVIYFSKCAVLCHEEQRENNYPQSVEQALIMKGNFD